MPPSGASGAALISLWAHHRLTANAHGERLAASSVAFRQQRRQSPMLMIPSDLIRPVAQGWFDGMSSRAVAWYPEQDVRSAGGAPTSGGPRQPCEYYRCPPRRTHAETLLGQKHADLTVLDPSRRAAVRALHAHALLLIDNEHAVRVGPMLPPIRLQVVPHGVSFPDCASQQMPEPMRTGSTGLLGQLPTVPALDRTQQSLPISQRRPTWLGAKKAGADPLNDLLQLSRPGDRIRRRRTCYRQENPSPFIAFGYSA
jgi:hypothetical protein